MLVEPELLNKIDRRRKFLFKPGGSTPPRAVVGAKLAGKNQAVFGEFLSQQGERANQGRKVLDGTIDRGAHDVGPASRKGLLGSTVEAIDVDRIPNGVDTRFPATAVVLQNVVLNNLRDGDYRIALSQGEFVVGTHPNTFGPGPVFREMEILQIVDDRHRPAGSDDRRGERIGKQDSVETGTIDKPHFGFRRDAHATINLPVS